MKSRSRTTSSSQDVAETIVQELTILRDAVDAKIAELEAERGEHRKKIAILRAAEMAAPRKRAIYFRLARLMLNGVGSDIVASHLARLKPEVLRKIANALEATEKDVDRGGLKVVKAYLAARREKGADMKLKDVEEHYKEQNPGQPVPQRQSLSKTLRRKELWRGKRGAPRKEKADKTR